MREIKFRAWDKKENKWIHGPGMEVNLLGETIIFGELIKGISLVRLNDLVVLQFTGLKDKNGKEIYEGDLIELDEYGTGKVIFDEGMFQYVPLNGSWEIEPGVTCQAFYPVTRTTVEVIGNIFQNKELLNP